MVFGINSCLSLFKAKKLQIISIHIMIDGNADKNKACSDFIKQFPKQAQRISKKDFLNKYSGLRTQGIVTYFKGKLYKDMPDF